MLHRMVHRYPWLALSITLVGLIASGVAWALGPRSAHGGPGQAATVSATATVAALVHATEAPAEPAATMEPAVFATPTPTTMPSATPAPDPTATPAPPTAAPTTDSDVRTARVPILMYHYISNPPPNADAYRRDLSVPPQVFEAQLAYLKEQGYTSISLQDLYYHMKDGAPLPPKPIILTFDDGYADNYTYAFPLLCQYGFKGTFFVITDLLDSNHPAYISWDQARIMQEKGMDIEAHSRSHIDLRKKGRAELIWQIVGSREAIEAQLHKPVRFFAYPSGRYDWGAITVLYESGYWGAVTTMPGSVHSSNAPFARSRIRVHGGDGLDKFKQLLARYS